MTRQASYRTATTDDAPIIADLVNRAYRPTPEHAGWTHESELVSGERTNAQQIIELLQRPDSLVLLALDESNIIGCVHLEKDAEHCYIGMLAIDPTRQAHGLGKQLLAQAEQFGKARFNPEQFRMVVVSARQELIEFYLRRGYQKTNETMPYPSDAGVGLPKREGMVIEVLCKNISPPEPN